MEKQKRVAVVTGAARGIGRAIALALGTGDAIVAVVDIDGKGAESVAGEITAAGGEAAAFCVDVADVSQIAGMTAGVAEKFGRVDILVNNAGILSTAPIETLGEDEWDRVMAINVKSAAFASREALRYMRAQGWGRIINITSLAGRMGGVSTGCAYSASKAALIGLTMCLARKTAAEGITVNAIAPGTTEGQMVKGFTDEELAKARAAIPVGRLGKPEEIAAVAAFLASDAAAFITGAVIDVNGGMFIG